MSRLQLIKGQRFDKLTVISDGIPNLEKERRLRLCLCDCGNLVWRTRKSLFRYEKQSCGIKHKSKICTKCKIEKDKSEFHNSKTNTGTLTIQTVCKICKGEFYKRNADKIEKRRLELMKDPKIKEHKRLLSRKHWRKRQEKEKIYKKEYYTRPHVKKRQAEIHQKRRTTDLQYIFKKRLRWRLRDIIKKSLKDDCYKYKSALDLLGCDIMFLKKHLESTFTEGMSWDKITELHVDHIRPCNTFDLTILEEQKKCFNWKNLQMLWWEDNLTKGKNEIR